MNKSENSLSDFYKNTNRDRETYKRFKRMCYIPIYGLIGFYYPIFMKNFSIIKPMSFDEADNWSKFGRRLHLFQGICITVLIYGIINFIF